MLKPTTVCNTQAFKVYPNHTLQSDFFALESKNYIPNKHLSGISKLTLQNFLYLNVFVMIPFVINVQIQSFLRSFPVSFPNTADVLNT